MTGFISRVKLPKIIALAAMVLAFGAGSLSLAQMPVDSASQVDMPRPPMSENELENLVAPIALYPDALLSQVLVASTYPLEVFEAQRWLQENGNLRNRELMEAAQQQDWDPSVQALVAFPDVVARLNLNVDWTTELGNAFLAQQADVMTAIQNLRAEARQNGRLQSTPQLSVSMEVHGDQSAVEIQPGDPQRMYVPNYDPNAVWGPPAEGAYPSLPYAEGSGFGSLLGTVANLAGLLPGFGGLLGPRSWGWALSWLTQALFVNNSFFSDFGFHGYGGGSGGTSLWVHDWNRGFGGRHGNTFAGWHGRGTTGQGGEGWRRFGSGSRAGAGAGDRQSLSLSLARSGQSFERSTGRQSFRGDSRGGNWRQFGAGGRTESAGQFGRTFSESSSQASRTGDRRLQRDYRGGRDTYFANSADNRAGSFRGSRSLESGSRNNGFANFGSARRESSSRTLTASRTSPRTSTRSSGRAWGKEPRLSTARMSSERGSSFGRGSSSRHDSSWKHGFSSHSSGPKAPKFKAPHYAKAHGGGHSSGGHSRKRSHRG